jgi:hypothetical protein
VLVVALLKFLTQPMISVLTAGYYCEKNAGTMQIKKIESISDNTYFVTKTDR